MRCHPLMQLLLHLVIFVTSPACSSVGKKFHFVKKFYYIPFLWFLYFNQIVGFPNNIKAYDGIVWVEPNKHLMKGWMRALLEHSELEQDSQVFKKGSTYVRLVRRPMAKEPIFFLQLWFHWTSESPWSLSPCVLISLPPTLHCLLSERSPHCTESKTFQLSNGFN